MLMKKFGHRLIFYRFKKRPRRNRDYEVRNLLKGFDAVLSSAIVGVKTKQYAGQGIILSGTIGSTVSELIF